MPRHRPLAAVAGLAVLAALVTACSSAGSSAPEPSAPAVTSSAAAPSPTVAPTPDLLTGRPPASSAPVIALKVDNALLARKYQRGLDQAAIVFQELVEGGSTRFIAVFSGAPDVEVGPIRSARQSDLELLQQFGPLALGFSGAQAPVLADIAKAVRAGTINDVSYDAVPSDYRLGEQRSDARNFFTNPAKLASSRPAASPPRDIGLVFSTTPLTGTPAVTVTGRFATQSSDVMTYDAAKGTYSVSQSGTAVNGLAPVNVVIQHVTTTLTKLVDVHGVATPYTVSIGTGALDVLRGGTMVSGTWTRANATVGTTFHDAGGAQITLAPGPTFWLLLPTTGSVTVG